jgi:hypothetical protein
MCAHTCEILLKDPGEGTWKVNADSRPRVEFSAYFSPEPLERLLHRLKMHVFCAKKDSKSMILNNFLAMSPAEGSASDFLKPKFHKVMFLDQAT